VHPSGKAFRVILGSSGFCPGFVRVATGYSSFFQLYRKNPEFMEIPENPEKTRNVFCTVFAH
jgi:hypothetical protein